MRPAGGKIAKGASSAARSLGGFLTTTVISDGDMRLAAGALQAGDVQTAERLLRGVLAAQPGHVAALNILSIVLIRSGRFAEAENYLRRAVQEYAHSDATLSNYGLVLTALKRPAEALERFSQALKINPSSAETWNLRGRVLNELHRPVDAIADFDRAIQRNPNFAEAFYNKAMALLALGRGDEAIDSLDRAIAAKPAAAELHLLRAKLLSDLGRRGAALEGIDILLAATPNLPDAWLGRSNVLFELKRYEEASAACERAVALKPGFAEAWHACGNVLTALGRYADALNAYDKALGLNARLAGAWHGRGNVCSEAKRYQDALVAYEKALAMRPDLAEAWLGRGNVLTELNRLDEALAAFDEVLALRLDFAEAWLGRGNVFIKLKRRGEALAAYDRMLEVNPDLAVGWLVRGDLFAELRQYDEALAAYDRALTLSPDLKYAKGSRLRAKLQLADWSGIEMEVSDIVSASRAGKSVITPFLFVTISSSAGDQLECAKRAVADQPSFPAIWKGEQCRHDRIRVAYISADFREHAIAYLSAGLFEHHDRSLFQITAISLRPDSASPTRCRIEEAVEQFVEVRDKSDADIADLVRRLEIDIVVDLMGFVGGNRLGIIARRAAPIQVNFLGFPGTMGADFVDYIIADPTIIPEEHFPFYGERVVWLPDTYQSNDARRQISERTPTRRECGLPEAGFVFCCFNNTYKITPEIFDIWMRLLGANEASVLWLIEGNTVTRTNLGEEAQRRGIAPDRLIFAPRMPLADHLARHRLANLFLDTLPYNAHTTASDALWAGLPVLTCLGPTFAGRVAGSLLRAIGLDELVTYSLQDYEALALKLAREPSHLGALKGKLARNRSTYPLFDTGRFTRNLEAAYSTMWQRHRRGEPPAHFAVHAGD
ncbi:MAG: tetratricopeptide repeat protein [Xanthobacteraceae bacterium]